MKNIFRIILGLILILNVNQTNSQEVSNDTIVPVSLEEVVVSTPFNESLKKTVEWYLKYTNAVANVA